MAQQEIITSAQNPRLKNLKKLDKASERRQQNLFLIEGLREVILACEAGYELTDVFVCPEILKEDDVYALSRIKAPGAKFFRVSPEAYNSVAYRETTEGIIATAQPQKHLLQNIRLSSKPLILVIEGVEKPGNLGAMLRTCDAAGADAVIICDPKTDLYNPNVIRSSIGTVFTNQLAVCDTGQAIGYLHNNHIISYAAELNATEAHYQKNFDCPTAIVVGTEANGLSAQWINAASERIKIPMLGKIDSLNVSVSAAVLLFEAVRQRQQTSR
jgi:TrmH family RNA methyltransferase